MMPGLYVFAAVGIVAGALGFVGGWQTQGWRLGEQISKMKEAQAEAVNVATRTPAARAYSALRRRATHLGERNCCFRRPWRWRGDKRLCSALCCMNTPNAMYTADSAG